jgi:hypothetical protein
MLFSGLIFIDSFSKSDRKDSALGSNLMGALVGGALQSVTYLVGIRALLLVVAALYAAALACRPRQKTLIATATDRPVANEIEQELLESMQSVQASLRAELESQVEAPIPRSAVD